MGKAAHSSGLHATQRGYRGPLWPCARSPTPVTHFAPTCANAPFAYIELLALLLAFRFAFALPFMLAPHLTHNTKLSLVLWSTWEGGARKGAQRQQPTDDILQHEARSVELFSAGSGLFCPQAGLTARPINTSVPVQPLMLVKGCECRRSRGSQFFTVNACASGFEDVSTCAALRPSVVPSPRTNELSCLGRAQGDDQVPGAVPPPPCTTCSSRPAQRATGHGALFWPHREHARTSGARASSTPTHPRSLRARRRAKPSTPRRAERGHDRK
jgi:hypothetical protein